VPEPVACFLSEGHQQPACSAVAARFPPPSSAGGEAGDVFVEI
jgi:hypothetical protein